MLPDEAGADLRQLAREFLQLQQSRHEQNQTHRPYFARLAQTYGLSNREIGEVYGVTEAAVRMMVKRAVK